MNCIECKKVIIDGAHKCTECGSHQDWRRYFASGSMVLSLVVALISVLALSVEKIEGILTKYDSNLMLAGVVVLDSSITLVALNDGGQAAAIMWAELEVQDPRAGVNQINFVEKMGNYVVGPHEVRQIQLVPQGDINEAHANWLDEFSESDWKTSTQGIAECILTINTATKAGMEAISSDATNESIKSKIPFGAHEEHSKNFYFRIPCEKIFAIPMPVGEITLEVTGPNTDGN